MQLRTRRSTRIAVSLAALALAVPLAACSAATQHTLGMPVDGVQAQSGALFDSAAVDMSAAAPEALAKYATDREGARSIITNGSTTVEVKDARDAVAEATKIASRLGGRVEAQSISGYSSGSGISGTADSANLTIRVPAQKLDEAFNALAELGVPLSEERSATDVTSQHVDLQARVESLSTSVTRLTELMQGAASTSELIEAESALAARQAELDSLTAQLKMLETEVDESTIWVNFTTKSALPGGPANFWEGLLTGLSSLTVAGAGALVILGILLPWLVIAAAVSVAIVLIVRSRRKRRASRAARQAQAADSSVQPAAENAAPQQQQQPQLPPAEL